MKITFDIGIIHSILGLISGKIVISQLKKNGRITLTLNKLSHYNKLTEILSNMTALQTISGKIFEKVLTESELTRIWKSLNDSLYEGGKRMGTHGLSKVCKQCLPLQSLLDMTNYSQHLEVLRLA